MKMAQQPGSPTRPRQVRLRTSMLLLLCLVTYMWLTASRSLLVEHISVTETMVATLGGRGQRANRALREAASGPGAAAGSALLDPEDFRRCRRAKPGVGVPRLAGVRQWRSARPRRAESVTLVTQLSLERLEMLENQCRTWPDALAAVVYTPTVGGRIASAEDEGLQGAGLEEAVARLAAFVERMQDQGACTLDVELATEDFGSEEEAGLYPFNAARNRALMLAQTEEFALLQAVLLLDADFVPAPFMVEEYNTPEGYAELMQQLGRGQAIVLPAFETADSGEEGKQLALEAVRRGKAFASAQYAAGRLLGFQVAQYEAGHSPTNYPLWLAQDLPYVVDYTKGYEPYVLLARQYTPWYDERFRGYGRDKIQHLTHLAGLNMTFSVHPTSFVVHVPHAKAPTFKATKASGQWDKLYQLYVEVQKDVRKQRFVPVVSWVEAAPHLCSGSKTRQQLEKERRAERQAAAQQRKEQQGPLQAVGNGSSSGAASSTQR